MELSKDIISDFVKLTKNSGDSKKETTAYGTIVKNDTSIYVKIDGSEYNTPVYCTADVKNGDRVTVLIKNHSAIVTGNITSPAARVGDVIYNESTINALVTAIEQNASDISLRATKVEVSTAKQEAIDTAASDATAKANNAISTAASDATSKANQALSDAKSYTESQLKITSDGLEAKVEEIKDGAVTAGKVLSFTTEGLVIGDTTQQTMGNNILIDTDGVHIRNGDVELALFKDNGFTFSKNVTFTATDILINNEAYAYLGRNAILWSGAAYMGSGQIAQFASNVSRQLTGVVFVWSRYLNGAAVDQNWRYFFVPKKHVLSHGGDSIIMSDAYLGFRKILYVSNSSISGHADNAISGTSNGIAWNNTNYVLRYVIGV